MAAFCHTVMTLRNVSAALQPTLRSCAGATRTLTCLLGDVFDQHHDVALAIDHRS